MEPPASGGGRVRQAAREPGIFAIKVEGKAAHAGLEPEKGASAILELARQTEQLHAINGSGSGITLNVGVVHGGRGRTSWPLKRKGRSTCAFQRKRSRWRSSGCLRKLKPIDERTKVFVSGGINRPPLERTSGGNRTL